MNKFDVMFIFLIVLLFDVFLSIALVKTKDTVDSLIVQNQKLSERINNNKKIAEDRLQEIEDSYKADFNSLDSEVQFYISGKWK